MSNIKQIVDRVVIGRSCLTDNVYAGVLDKSGNWQHKTDVTNRFIDCVIGRWENQTEVITCGTDRWEITVKKLNNPH